jgi:hypothetical protein
MNKKVMILFILLIAVTISASAWAEDKSQTMDKSGIHNAAPVEKVSFSTDLGKGMPYPGLSAGEQAKLEESIKNQQPIQPALVPQVKIEKPKNEPNSNVTPTIQSATLPPIKSYTKPEPLTTDLGKDTPYPGLSPQEREKLQNEGSK